MPVTVVATVTVSVPVAVSADGWLCCAGGGWTAVVHPFTPILAGPETGSIETLVTADISLDDIKDAKMWVDTTGHFSRPDIFRLVVDMAPKKGATFQV